MRLAIAIAVLATAACNQNNAPGADREAQVEAPLSPAAVTSAGSALAGIATEAVALESMTDADIGALGGYAGHCVFRTTEVGFPSFWYEPGGGAAIKLNDKLVRLSAQGARRFADGSLAVELRPVAGEGNAGLRQQELVLALPGASDEHGYRGYVQCYDDAGESLEET